MEALQKLHKIISEHSDDFDTVELMEIAECIWKISEELNK